jgi:hypothetical protein
MINSVKSLVLFIILPFFSNNKPHAQLKLSLSNSIGPDIQKVIADYPNRFDNILGDVIIQNSESVDYECNFKVNNAESTSITLYTSSKKELVSFQSVLLSTEDFDKASKKFKSVFGQLNNLSVQPDGYKLAHLKGAWAAPSEQKKFTTILFSLTPPDDALKKLKVELNMRYEFPEWKVTVLVYDKEREDNERGNTIEQ